MLLTLVAALTLTADPAPAPAPKPTVTVTEAWVRLPPPGAKNTGAFMLLTNDSRADRKLVSASNPASRVTELHTHLNEGGVMKMRQVPAMDVKAGGKTELKPGSLHVMLLDLVGALKEGEAVPLRLTFDDGSTTDVKAVVKKFDPQQPH
ncbi:MAG: copper chaperone PCu(A)C [Archangium sp.]|nr:copper chaperone PCu(A)C [Archangium sp.]